MSKTYDNITPAIWQRIKESSARDHGTRYEPADEESGSATTDTVVGKIVMTFHYDSDDETLEYDIQSKPVIVRESQIWDGIEKSIESCRKA